MKKLPTVRDLVARYEQRHSPQNRIVEKNARYDSGRKLTLSLDDHENNPGLFDPDHETDLDLLENPPCTEEVNGPISLDRMRSFR